MRRAISFTCYAKPTKAGKAWDLPHRRRRYEALRPRRRHLEATAKQQRRQLLAGHDDLRARRKSASRLCSGFHAFVCTSPTESAN